MAMSVAAFLDAIEDEERRKDAKRLHAMIRELTDLEPAIWSGGIVGYGSYHYKYASGREGDWFRIGFAPRKQGMSLYLMADFEGEAALMKRLGKHKRGRACVTFRRLEDLDELALRELIAKSAKGTICSEANE